MRWLPYVGVIAACLGLRSGPLQAQIGVGPAFQNAHKVASIIDQTGSPVGNCFYVDRRGYVATAFSSVQHCTKAIVVFNSGDRFPVLGLVNASRGKDIAILALQGVPADVPALNLRADADPALGDSLLRWAGPIAARANVPANFARGIGLNQALVRTSDSPELPPTLSRKLRGDEFLLGIAVQSQVNCGRDPDTNWLWLDQARDRACAGSPVFDEVGDVVAMASGCLETGQAIYSAVHIKHVVAAIPDENPKVRPLSVLREWSDPVPIVEDVPLIDDQSTHLGGQLVRGLPLAERYRDLQRRLVLAEQETALVAKLRTKTLARVLELQPEIEKLAGQIDAIEPEERYTETETRTRPKSGSEDEEEEYEVEVTRFRFSERQKAVRDSLAQEHRNRQTELARCEIALGFIRNCREPYVKQLQARLADELFYLADPLGLRSAEDHGQYLAELTSTIEQGGAPGIIYLLRAMSRVTLDDHEGAQADLNEAVDADPRLKSLASAVEARSLPRNGKSKGKEALVRAVSVSKNDPRVLMLAARGALDRGDASLAARYLMVAAPTCPDEAELRLCLAWVHATLPGTGKGPSIPHTEAAIRLTAGADWSSLAAMAAAKGRAKEFDEATRFIEAAARLAPEEARGMCAAWRAELANKQPVRRKWK